MKIRTLLLSAAIGVSGLAMLPSAQASGSCDLIVFSGRIVGPQSALVNAGAAGCTADADTQVLTPGADTARVGVLTSFSASAPTDGTFTQNGVTTAFSFTQNVAGTRWESPLISLTTGDVTATAVINGVATSVTYVSAT